MINKKDVILKVLYFVCGIILLSLHSILNAFNIITPDSYFLNSVLVFVCIIVSVLVVYQHNKVLRSNIYFSDVILSFCLSMLLYGIYFIPIFGFFKLAGANNSIVLIFVFILYSLFLREISTLLSKRKNDSSIAINNRNTINVKWHFAIVLKYISYVLIAASFLGAIFNIVIPKIDMSMPIDYFLKGM